MGCDLGWYLGQLSAEFMWENFLRGMSSGFSGEISGGNCLYSVNTHTHADGFQSVIYDKLSASCFSSSSGSGNTINNNDSKNLCLLQGCLSLSAVKTAFQETGHKLSSRDCKAMAVSALTGLV